MVQVNDRVRQKVFRLRCWRRLQPSLGTFVALILPFETRRRGRVGWFNNVKLQRRGRAFERQLQASVARGEARRQFRALST